MCRHTGLSASCPESGFLPETSPSQPPVGSFDSHSAQLPTSNLQLFGGCVPEPPKVQKYVE